MNRHDFRFILRIDDRGEEVLRLRRSSSESTEHIVLKLLAYCCLREWDPEVERNLDRKYKPDLVSMNGRHVRMWAECGKVSPGKLADAARRNKKARIFVFKAGRSEAHAMAELIDEVRDRIELMYLEKSVIDEIESVLLKHNTLEVIRENNILYIKLNETGVMAAVKRVEI